MNKSNSKNKEESFDSISIFPFLIYLVLQLLFSTTALSIYNASCFVYLGSLAILPIKSNKLSIHLIIAFFIGLTIDHIYNILGPHASASVLFIYSRAQIAKLILPNINYNKGISSSPKKISFFLFIMLTILPILIHNLFLYFIEASDLSLFLILLQKSLLSSIFTSLVLLILGYTLRDKS